MLDTRNVVKGDGTFDLVTLGNARRSQVPRMNAKKAIAKA